MVAPNIVRWHQPDELATAPSLAFEDDSWFAAAQRCFVGVAIAGAAAALSTSVAIAGTFNQQSEVVPAAAAAVDDGAGWPLLQPKLPEPTYLVWADEGEGLNEAPLPVDEEPWAQPAPAAAKFHLLPPFAQDEIGTAAIVEEAHWAPPAALPPALAAVPQWDDQALAWSIDEVYEWRAQWLPAPLALPQPWAQQDEVPQPPFEEGWLPPTPPERGRALTPWADDDFAPPQQTLAAEEYWLRLESSPVAPIAAVWWHADEVPTPATPLPVDETYWHTLPLPQGLPNPAAWLYPPVDEDVPPLEAPPEPTPDPRVHGFEMVGDPPKRRRNLVTVIKPTAAEEAEEAKPRPTITKREIDRRLFEKARDEARELIGKAATEHAASKHSKAERFAEVRTSLKPLAKALGDWNWIAVYQRMYQDALDAALRGEIARQDALIAAAEEEDERELMKLVMEWM